MNKYNEIMKMEGTEVTVSTSSEVMGDVKKKKRIIYKTTPRKRG